MKKIKLSKKDLKVASIFFMEFNRFIPELQQKIRSGEKKPRSLKPSAWPKKLLELHDDLLLRLGFALKSNAKGKSTRATKPVIREVVRALFLTEEHSKPSCSGAIIVYEQWRPGLAGSTTIHYEVGCVDPASGTCTSMGSGNWTVQSSSGGGSFMGFPRGLVMK